ncbi:MAG: zinc-binding dehydrogenase [Acidimicrobiales bacterium]|nr:zinc-binding dehydrogenase [Acidimicrobiales bacterium]
MKAAVMRSGALVVDDLPDPVPGPGQLLVRTLACGICGSDLHTLQHADQMADMATAAGGGLGEAFPTRVMDVSRDVVMGHEFSAEVLACGPNAEAHKPGDVVVSLPVTMDADGIHPIGYSNSYPGGYGELMVLSDLPLLTHTVPNGLDPHLAALTEPMAVGLHAVKKSVVRKGDSAIVLGCGPVGLAVIAALVAEGAEPIIAADFSTARRQLAATMGAHVVVDPRQEPAIEAWRHAAGSKRVVIFEAVGVPGLIDQAMHDAPRAAQIVVVGVCMESDQVRPMLGIVKELNVQFVFGYDPIEFGETLRRIAEGELDVTPMITGRVPIDGVAQAFTDLADPERHAKILVVPNG